MVRVALVMLVTVVLPAMAVLLEVVLHLGARA